MATIKKYSDKDIKIRLHTKFMIGIIVLESLLISAIITMVENQIRE